MYDETKVRALRFATLGKIQKLVWGENSKTGLGVHRVAKCFRNLAPFTHGEIDIKKNLTTNKAMYTNLLVCNSVWLCPVCSAKINNKRADEVAKAVEYAYKNGYTVAMLTFTHPHKKGEPLEKLMIGHKEALKSFKQGKFWETLRHNTGYVGMITGNEITHGWNGWHFHSHVLLILKDDTYIRENEIKIKKIWLKRLQKKGIFIEKLESALEVCIDFMYDCNASKYLAKAWGEEEGENGEKKGAWGIDREITKGAQKKGRGKVPFDLANGTAREKALFMEYYHVIMKYKTRQLVWSRGLKAKVGLQDKTDEELNNYTNEELELIMSLLPKEWAKIIKKGLRAKVLELAEIDGKEGVEKFLHNQ